MVGHICLLTEFVLLGQRAVRGQQCGRQDDGHQRPDRWRRPGSSVGRPHGRGWVGGSQAPTTRVRRAREKVWRAPKKKKKTAQKKKFNKKIKIAG